MAELLSDFLQRQIVVPPAVVGRGVLPVKGKCIIGGEPKANKSFLAMNLALGIATGTALFDAAYKSGTPVFPVPRARRVLYIEQEIGQYGLRQRFKPLLAAWGISGEFPFYVKSKDTAMRMDSPEGRLAIQREIEEVRPDVLILDPFAKFHLSDENSAQQMGAVLRVADHWIEDYNVAVVLVHHTGKENPEYPKRGGAKLRGSSAIFGDVDTFVDVVRKSANHVKEPILQLDFELRQGEPLERVYVKRLRDGRVVYCGEDFSWGSPVGAGGSSPGRGVPYDGL